MPKARSAASSSRSRSAPARSSTLSPLASGLPARATGESRRCHRRLLADVLLARGHRATHLDSRGGTEPHRLTDFAVLEGGRLRYPPPQAALDL